MRLFACLIFALCACAPPVQSPSDAQAILDAWKRVEMQHNRDAHSLSLEAIGVFTDDIEGRAVCGFYYAPGFGDIDVVLFAFKYDPATGDMSSESQISAQLTEDPENVTPLALSCAEQLNYEIS